MCIKLYQPNQVRSRRQKINKITMPPKVKKKSKPKPVVEPVYVPIFADIDDVEGSEFERMTRTDCRSLMAPPLAISNSTAYSAAS
jgi:hypothetical protein